MIMFPIYQALKLRLAATGVPVFYYIGQYLPGKENISLRVPAIYLEMPTDVTLNFYGRKIMSAKDAPVNIHYISYAPFKNSDNSIQDTAIQQHELMLKDIDVLINGWNVKDLEENNLTEQFITRKGDLLKFQKSSLVSVLKYTTEIYSKHLQT